MRMLVAVFVPGAATFASWWLLLGLDPNGTYSVPQCAGLVLLLIAIGVGAAWVSQAGERAAVIVSAGLGLSADCFTSWMDDPTGLFLLGWMMLTPPAFLGAAAVVLITVDMKSSRDNNEAAIHST